MNGQNGVIPQEQRSGFPPIHQGPSIEVTAQSPVRKAQLRFVSQEGASKKDIMYCTCGCG